MTLSGIVPAGLPEASRRLAVAWFVFAVAALGISTLFALLLIASRTPGVGALFSGHGFFYSALVLHVDLSAVVWVLAAGSALLALVSPSRAPGVGWFALALGIAGAVLMALGPLPGQVEVLKSNYVPVLRSWQFLAGLGMFALAAALMALPTVVLLRPWQFGASERPVTFSAYGAAWGVLLAVVAAGWGLALIPDIFQPADYFELLFWGPGHILQLANTLFMLLAWLWLAGAPAMGTPPDTWALSGLGAACGLAVSTGRHISRVLLFLGLFPLLAVPILLLAFPPASAEFKTGFTELMRWGSWLAAVPLGLILLRRLRGNKEMPDSLRTGLRLSILLFFFGIAIGTFIRTDNVMVPAHYHGTIGAVTLALMTVCLQQLPRLGFPPVRAALARWQLRLYGGGTLLMALSLAVSGWMGVSRKLPGDVQAETLTDTGSAIAMGFAGMGGALAVAGSVLFVASVLAVFGKKGTQGVEGRISHARVNAINRRLFAGLAVAGLAAALGSLFAVLQDAVQKPSAIAQLPPHSDLAGHIAAAEKQEIALRFRQAVAMLHAKKYEYAVTALDRILKIRPDMPEAHVNRGYALLGLKQYQAAYDSFDKATVLRPMQANAYYGMAEALYELGDLERALGAMRSYVHLSASNDPYVRRANSALWEWEEELKARKTADTAASRKGKAKPS